MRPRRIVILGVAGTGKTTFSRQLAGRIGAPHVCLDAIWPPSLKPTDVPTFRELVKEAHAGDTWVSDGNFAATTVDLRLPRADLVLWLERPTWLCALNAVRRLAESGQAHTWRGLPDALRFISRFDRVNRPRIMAALAEHGPRVPVRHFGSRAEAAAFIAEVGG